MQYEKFEKKQHAEDFVRIQDLWNMSVSKWHWFVISLTISLLIAFVYISITSPIYMRTVSVLINDTSKGSKGADADIFAGLGIVQSNININNEVLTFKSPLLMQEVVQRLGLDVNYSVKGFFRDKVLYKDAPISVLSDSVGSGSPFSCSIELLPQNKIRISGLICNGNDSNVSETIEGTFSEPVNTPWGDIVIKPTSFYSERYYNKQILFSRSSFSGVVNHYAGALHVSLSDEKSTIIDISLNDVSIRRAEDILNTLVTVYNENWVKDKNQIAISTSLFIDERLDVIEDELGNVDDNISRFKSQNLMPDIQAASNLYMNQSTENSAKLLALNTQQSIANYVLVYLRDSKTKDQLLPANLGIGNAGIEGQITEYNTTLLRYNSLLANSSDKNPIISDMDNSLNAMRKAVIGSIENLLVTLDTQIKDTQKSERQTTERIASSPKQAKHLLSIERQQKIKETLYLFLLQKREENQLSQAFTAYNTKIITPPSGGMFPIAPRKMTVLLLAVIIGLLLPGVIIFLLENLDTTVRSYKDLSSLSFPFIGEIPQVIKSKGNKKIINNKNNIIVEEGKRDYMNEAFRMVRTNLDFMIGPNDEEYRKVIMFTSFNIGSGKTFTAVNLAMSMAIMGKKVVAVDLDMRKASLNRYVGTASSGVSNYLGKMSDDPAGIIVKGRLHPNLDIIPVGTIPPNPTELLLNGRLGILLNRLREQYDYIFLDCTPVKIVADASIVAKLSDLTVFVVRCGLMDKRMLPEVESFKSESTIENMAVILNGVDYQTNRYGYRKYGYEYGYGE